MHPYMTAACHSVTINLLVKALFAFFVYLILPFWIKIIAMECTFPRPIWMIHRPCLRCCMYAHIQSHFQYMQIKNVYLFYWFGMRCRFRIGFVGHAYLSVLCNLLLLAFVVVLLHLPPQPFPRINRCFTVNSFHKVIHNQINWWALAPSCGVYSIMFTHWAEFESNRRLNFTVN